ncbi:MAG: hypothetical protein IPM64_00125 [Phycisphaerales bacterium]|nr:hypothetical protein [Phycisphaerales bacterium]
MPEDATAADVQAAYGRHYSDAKIAGREVRSDIALARSILMGDEQRRFYRDRIRDCRTKQPLTIPAEKRPEFLAFCERVQIRWWADPSEAGVFHLRMPGQQPPDFVVDASRIEQRRQRLDDREVERKEDRAYRRSNAGKVFFLRFGYTYAFAFAAVALFAVILVWGFDGTFSRLLHVSDTLQERGDKQIERDEREAFALANDALTQLQTNLDSFRETVRRDLGTSIDAKTIPDELATVISKESTVAAAWKALRDANAALAGLPDRVRTKEAIQRRMNEKSVLKADLDSLREMQTWAENAETKLKTTKQNIEHIRAMLEAEQFNRAGQSNKEP